MTTTPTPANRSSLATMSTVELIAELRRQTPLEDDPAFDSHVDAVLRTLFDRLDVLTSPEHAAPDLAGALGKLRELDDWASRYYTRSALADEMTEVRGLVEAHRCIRPTAAQMGLLAQAGKLPGPVEHDSAGYQRGADGGIVATLYDVTEQVRELADEVAQQPTSSSSFRPWVVKRISELADKLDPSIPPARVWTRGESVTRDELITLPEGTALRLKNGDLAEYRHPGAPFSAPDQPYDEWVWQAGSDVGLKWRELADDGEHMPATVLDVPAAGTDG